MRILVYTTQVRFPGGYENLARSLAETLADRGIESYLLCHYPAEFRPEGECCAPQTPPRGLPVHYLNVPTQPSLWEVARAVLRLRQLVRSLKIDAIEVSGHGPSLLARLATVGVGVRLAIGIHDVVERRPSMSWLHSGLSRFERKARRVNWFGVSRAATNSWCQVVGERSGRALTIHNSIDRRFFLHQGDSREFVRRQIGATRSDRVVLCAGRLMIRKGQDIVLEALAPLLREHRVHLVFAGRPDIEPGDDGARISTLMAEARDSVELRQHVHFLGLRTDMAALMASADWLIHVPRKEAFGLVLVEALAIGLPIIASAVGGIPEVVAGTDTILVPPEDPLALRNAFLDCLGWCDERQAECIRKGRERAMDFHPDRRTDQILALLQGSRH